MQCIAFATADQYHLPTLCHDLIGHGFREIDLPRGTCTVITQTYPCIFYRDTCDRVNIFSDASNVLVISTEMTAKPDDDALMFFFRWPFIFS